MTISLEEDNDMNMQNGEGIMESTMQERKQWTELSWGWISGTALGIGSAVGVAWQSWALFFAITILITAFMVWRARRVPTIQNK